MNTQLNGLNENRVQVRWQKNAVFFDGLWDAYGTQEPKKIKGYYSTKQPNYHWSFCENINEAKLWKTKNGAQKKIDHQKICSYRDLVGKIIEIEVEEMKIK